MITFSKLGNPQYGRLGNQLFQIAATIGIAHVNGQDFGFPNWEYSKYFVNSLPPLGQGQFKLYRQNNSNYSPILLPLGNWDLEGFFQSELYFLNCHETVRYYLTPDLTLEKEIFEKWKSILDLNTCSIHVRRGDYLKQSQYFPPQPIAYYNKAISMFSTDMIFLVFSDDLEWCKMHFTGEKFILITGGSEVTDLFLMSKCKNHILSNSSFSWWGAWLNHSKDKRVLCPERWFGPASAWKSSEYSKDIYSPIFEKVRISNRYSRLVSTAIDPTIFLYHSIKKWLKDIVKKQKLLLKDSKN